MSTAPLDLEAALRLAAAAYVRDLAPGGAVLELFARDGRLAERLVAEGAGRVVAIGSGLTASKTDKLELVPGDALELASKRTDKITTVVAVGVPASDVPKIVQLAGRILPETGALVLGVRSSDRAPQKIEGAMSYYAVVDALEHSFDVVQMAGVSPFVGVALAEYGNPEAPPVLDGTLVQRGERVEYYLAVASGKKVERGFQLVQVPAADVLRRAEARPEPKEAAPRVDPKKLGELEKQNAELRRRVDDLVQKEKAATANVVQLVAELEKTRAAARVSQSSDEQRLKQRIEELEAALGNQGGPVVTPEEHARVKAALADADTERQQQKRELQTLRDELAEARTRAATADANANANPDERVRALEAENQKLREREQAARDEAWKHMKARSEAEAQAAEVREDTVRKLKDARKLASVELTRTMEEATKKAVALREDLHKTLAENKQLRKELAELQAAGSAPAGDHPDTIALRAAQQRIETLVGTVRSLENDVDEIERELVKERLKKDGAAASEGERAVNDRAIADAQRRIVELEGELSRREQALERSAQLAAHERARAERMIADERRAMSLRNDAKARAAEAEARAAQLTAQVSALEAAFADERARAERAEQRLSQKGDAEASGPWELDS